MVAHNTNSPDKMLQDSACISIESERTNSGAIFFDKSVTSYTQKTKSLFGTDGIRGRVGALLNSSLAFQVGFWLGAIWRKKPDSKKTVILGQDSRNSSELLAMAVSAGLKESGLDVWHIGLCPTPCVACITSYVDAVGGIMISASHNQPQDNGIKIFESDGTKLSQTLQKEIEEAICSQKPTIIYPGYKGKHYFRPELTYSYVSSLKNTLGKVNFRGLRIVLDLAWGAAVEVAATVFKDMGTEVICLHDQPNGNRINVNCGSTCLNSLQIAVEEYSADLGFAFDGDADRVIAVDSQSRVVDGDYMLYFLGKDLKARNELPSDLIVSTVMANLGFEQAWKQLGGQFKRTAVGDRYVQEEMQRSEAKLGGEKSGHIICHHYSKSSDGLFTALHLSAIVRRTGLPLSEMMNHSFHAYPQLLHNVKVEDRERRLLWQRSEAIQNAIAQAQASIGNDGRVFVRASGTEPVIRIMVEAKSRKQAQYWTEQLALTVQQSI